MSSSPVLSDFIGLPVPIEPRSAGLHLILGSRRLPAWTLESLCPLLIGRNRIFWVEGGHGFDVHALGKLARARGMDPGETLDRISLARPFSALQMERMVSKKIPALLPDRPLILSDPLFLFDDEDLPERDADRTFVSFLSGLKSLALPVLGLVVERGKGRRRFLEALLGLSRSTARLVEDGPAPRLENFPVRA